MSEKNDNGFLYFAVGGLLVAVVVVGFMFYQNGSNANSGDVFVLETSAGKDKSGSTFKLEVDEKGFNASADTNDKN